MKTPRYRRIVGGLLGTSNRTGGPRARDARDVSIRAHRGPNDHDNALQYTGLTRPNRFY